MYTKLEFGWLHQLLACENYMFCKTLPAITFLQGVVALAVIREAARGDLGWLTM
jgi:hypothetical protein